MDERRVSASTVAVFASMLVLGLAAEAAGVSFGMRMLEHGVVVALLMGVTISLAVVGTVLAAAFAAFATADWHPLRLHVLY